MKSENIIGALIAAVIGFLTGFLALVTQEGVESVNDIGQLAWIVLGVGALLSFFKDMQALATRRGIANMTGKTNRVNSPVLAAIACAMLAFSVLSGCGVNRPDINSVEDGIAVTSADIETAAETVLDLCRNSVPGGACAAGAMISTSTKDRLRGQLQDALDTVRLAKLALAADNTFEAGDRLSRARSLLTILQAELRRIDRGAP